MIRNETPSRFLANCADNSWGVLSREDKVGRVTLCEGRGERGLEQNKEKNFRNEKPRVKGFRALPSESRYRIAVKIITVSEHPALKAFHRRYMERERERFDASVKCGCR